MEWGTLTKIIYRVEVEKNHRKELSKRFKEFLGERGFRYHEMNKRDIGKCGEVEQDSGKVLEGL